MKPSVFWPGSYVYPTTVEYLLIPSAKVRIHGEGRLKVFQLLHVAVCAGESVAVNKMPARYGIRLRQFIYITLRFRLIGNCRRSRCDGRSGAEVAALMRCLLERE